MKLKTSLGLLTIISLMQISNKTSAQEIQQSETVTPTIYFATTSELVEGVNLTDVITAANKYTSGSLSDKSNDTPEGKAYYAIGMALGDGNLPQGVDVFRRLYKGSETSSSDWLELSRLFYIGEIPSLSNEAADSVLANVDRNDLDKELSIEAQINKSYNLIATGNLDSAQRVLTDLVSLDSNNNEVLFGLAYTQYLKGDFSEAINSCNKINNRNPQVNSYILLSNIYRKLNDRFTSDEMYMEAVKLEELNKR